MKVTGGTARGQIIQVPKGQEVRPTPAMVREALFNILGAGVVGARVLDLYCGSGALGIEALSRGAESVLFVDQSPQVLTLVHANLQKLGLLDHAQLVRRTLPQQLEQRFGDPFDLVLSDPPYDTDVSLTLGRRLIRAGLVAENTTWVHEMATRTLRTGEVVTPPGWERIDERTYGDTTLLLMRVVV